MVEGEIYVFIFDGVGEVHPSGAGEVDIGCGAAMTG